MMSSPIRRWSGDTVLVAAVASAISLFAFLLYFQHGWILLYGDAVAHINIARRVFDSKTPGLLQLGTVWLPLPHLLMIPFLLSNAAWESGVGGSIPSLAGYVFSVTGIYRLVRNALSSPAEPDRGTRLGALLAAGIFAANPNLIYLQTTAMTEPLYLAFFIWAVVFYTEFAQATGTPGEEADSFSSRSLSKCAFCLAGAEATRYDGWFLALVIALATLWVLARNHRRNRRLGLNKFFLIIAAVPAFWLAYNAIVYRHPFEFATGPYSARAIEQKTATPGFPARPGSHNVVAAAQYFVKSAELNLAEGSLQKIWIVLALAGTVVVILFDRRLLPLLLLWVPLAFYILSIAYGGVPIFVPTWWPFSYYNVRYGVQLLPAFAVFTAVAVYFLCSLARPLPSRIAIAVLGVALVAASYTSVWKAQPVSFREAWVNSRSRIALETELAANLRKLPPNSTLLMYLGDHVGALQRAGVPLSHVIQEGNHRTWKQPADPEGLWERALANPSSLADFAIGIGDDSVSQSARKHGLASIVVIETPGQPRATIYATKLR